MFIFHLELNRHKHLFTLRGVRATVTNQLICKYAVEQIFHHRLLFGAFGQIFNPVNQHVKEFIDILLDSWVNRAPIKIFQGVAELFRIVVLFL
jgi:hypothetical protein